MKTSGKSKLVVACKPFKLSWLAEETKIEYKKLDRIVNGGQQPTEQEAKKIARVLGLPVADLFMKSETLYEHTYS